MGYSFLPILIPLRFLRDRRKKWDGGTKKWDHKVGPIVILMFKNIYFPRICVISLRDRAHKALADEERDGWIDSRSVHSLFSTFLLQKVETTMDILEENRR